jgi:hypothetical protein
MDAAVCSPAGPAWWWQAIRHRRTSLMSGGLFSQSPRDPWVHTPANMALLICYLPLRSSARTRRRATCISAVSALSRRSFLQRIGSWNRNTSVACCVITLFLLMIGPKFSGCLAVLSRLLPQASGLLRGV